MRALFWGTIRAVGSGLGSAVKGLCWGVESGLGFVERGFWAGVNFLGCGVRSLVRIPAAAARAVFSKANLFGFSLWEMPRPPAMGLSEALGGRIWGAWGVLGSLVCPLVESRSRVFWAASVFLNLVALVVWLGLPSALATLVKGLKTAVISSVGTVSAGVGSGLRAAWKLAQGGWKLLSASVPSLFWVSLGLCHLHVFCAILAGQLLYT